VLRLLSLPLRPGAACLLPARPVAAGSSWSVRSRRRRTGGGRQACWVVLLSLAGLAGWGVPGRAEVYVRAPFVTVVAGPPAPPDAPGFTLHLPFVHLTIRHAHRLAVPAAPPPPVLTPVPLPPPPPPVEEAPRPRPVAPDVPALPAGSPPVVQAPPPPPPVVKALTLDEFAAAFKPCPGTHRVCLIHPRTGQPVDVEFTLPAGAPGKVRVHRRELEFDYGRQRVDVRFQPRGGVRVVYR